MRFKFLVSNLCELHVLFFRFAPGFVQQKVVDQILASALPIERRSHQILVLINSRFSVRKYLYKVDFVVSPLIFMAESESYGTAVGYFKSSVSCP